MQPENNFDPYYKWLGIPPQEQPANFYRLLGIVILENDPDVIANAADRQMAHVRQFQGGKNSLLSQKLLNEIAFARVRLLNPQQKAIYDRSLSESIAEPSTNIKSTTFEVAPPSKIYPKRKQKPNTNIIGIVGAASIVLIGLLWFQKSHRELGLENSQKQQVQPVTKSPKKETTVVPHDLSATRARPPVAEAKKRVVEGNNTSIAKEKEVEKTTLVDPEPAEGVNDSKPTENSTESDTLTSSEEGEKEDSVEQGQVVEPPLDSSPNSSGKEKAAIPTADAQKQAKALVGSVHKQDYDLAKTPAQKAELAHKLFQEGMETADDLAAKYVLFTIARDLAISARDGDMTLEIIAELDKVFEIASLEMKSDSLAKIAVQIKQPEVDALMPSITQCLVQAVASDRYDLAKQLAETKLALARKAKNPSLIKQCAAEAKELAAIEVAYKGAKDQFAVLEKEPDNSAANLAVGRFLALFKANWNEGLPLLARGNDASLQQLAQLDRANPNEESEQVAVGDGWWDLSNDLKSVAKRNTQLRAEYWYRNALPKLSGIGKTKIEQRLAEIATTTQNESLPKVAANSQKSKEPKEPTVVAVWEHRGGDGPSIKIKLFSNGHIDSPTNPATWTSKGQVLIMHWPNQSAPGGAWIDTCKISADGRTYNGVNQSNLQIRGRWVSAQ